MIHRVVFGAGFPLLAAAAPDPNQDALGLASQIANAQWSTFSTILAVFGAMLAIVGIGAYKWVEWAVEKRVQKSVRKVARQIAVQEAAASQRLTKLALLNDLAWRFWRRYRDLPAGSRAYRRDLELTLGMAQEASRLADELLDGALHEQRLRPLERARCIEAWNQLVYFSTDDHELRKLSAAQQRSLLERARRVRLEAERYRIQNATDIPWHNWLETYARSLWKLGAPSERDDVKTVIKELLANQSLDPDWRDELYDKYREFVE